MVTRKFLSNGFLKSSIYRVVAPPPDRAGIDRLGVLYFVRPEDSLELRPVQSKVLQRLGYNSNENAAARQEARFPNRKLYMEEYRT
ncbi:flavonol synthase [Colletotrichum cuscutae]|uniref:Flavonol synthase n=1 Tax=Colletotrichum cuscutae TaxID=1209917 RepID=A0AAI9XI35_9PEZI|nr:flavonol synthase [Colletotrichum cuscutae]